MAQVHLSLGSNIGDRLANLRRAIEVLAPAITVQKTSRVYESEPHKALPQGLFYNIAIAGETQLSPHDLFAKLKSIEQQIGRSEAPRNAPREIDIDILFYDDLILDTPELTIPHPRLHERAFVLVPLEEIARFVEHPKLNMPIIELWDALGANADLIWEAEEQL